MKLTETQLSSIQRELQLSGQRRIVLLDVAGLKSLPAYETNRNVYCIGPAGDIHWQIEEGATTQERDSFVSLEINDKGEVRADRFFGNEFLVDASTGQVKQVGWHK